MRRGDEGHDHRLWQGQALQSWLANNGALNTNQTLPIRGVRVSLMKNNTNVGTMAMNPEPGLWQSWIRLTKNNGTLDTNLFPAQPSQYYSFTRRSVSRRRCWCGQMVWTDLHVAGGMAMPRARGGAGLPRGCTSKA